MGICEVCLNTQLNIECEQSCIYVVMQWKVHESIREYKAVFFYFLLNHKKLCLSA